MRGLKPVWMCATVLLTSAISVGAIAQGAAGGGPGGGGGGRGGFGRAVSIATLPSNYLTWALNLKSDQRTKIEEIQKKANGEVRALRQPDASGQQPDRAVIGQKMKEITDQAKKDIEAVLNSDQLKHEEDVVKEAGHFNAVGIPLAVVPELKLTANEKSQLADLGAEAAKSRQELMKQFAGVRQSGDQQKIQEMRTAMQAARKETQDKAEAILTASQKATLEAWRAAHPRGQRPGGGGGQGGNPAT